MTKQEQILKEADTYANNINLKFKSELTPGDKVSDIVASFGGSWRFIFLFASFLTIWVLWNSLPITKPYHFDDQPFILLNLCLSFIAAFQAPFIMMSQNRQSRRDRYVADIDFKNNYISQRDSEEIHDHMDEIVESTREIKVMYGEIATMYEELKEALPLIKDIHKYITENGWNTK